MDELESVYRLLVADGTALESGSASSLLEERTVAVGTAHRRRQSSSSHRPRNQSLDPSPEPKVTAGEPIRDFDGNRIRSLALVAV